MANFFVILLSAAICWPIGYLIIRPLLSPKEPNA